jgi:predicted anti-sigma-YlaC factor YlaD
VSACETFRPLLHERLDGELGPDAALSLDAHLAACPDCRSAAEGLAVVRSGLLALPEHPLPAEAIEEILDRTVRDRRLGTRFAAYWPAWAGAAALAALALLLLRFPLSPSVPAEIPPGDVAKAASEARLVLSLAAGALHRAERAAGNRILAGEIAPALRRVPIRWAVRPEPRKS